MSDDVTKIFEGVNHSTQEDELIPLREISHLVDPNDEIRSCLGLHANHVYYCPNSIPAFVYWKDFVWVDIWANTKKTLETLRILEMIEQFTDRIGMLVEQGDYQGVFSIVAKKPLFMLFKKHFEDIPLKDRYSIFRNIYRRSEYGFHHIDQSMWEKLLEIRSYSDDWNASMEMLRDKYKDAEKITVYRGENSSSTSLNEAWSWTLSYKTASFFATRFSDSGIIYETDVDMMDIADYLPYNGEEEVLIPPSKIVLVHEHHV